MRLLVGSADSSSLEPPPTVGAVLEEVSHEHVIAARFLFEVLHDLIDQIDGVTHRFLNVIRERIEGLHSLNCCCHSSAGAFGAGNLGRQSLGATPSDTRDGDSGAGSIRRPRRYL